MSSKKISMNHIFALAVTVIALVTFISTVAPTTSFWDCGEFIAASHTLGVPHPPGAPLYLLIGRLFSMIPFVSDIGLRVNMVSVLASTATVMLLYLCTVRLIRIFRGREEELHEKLAVYCAAAIGALTYTFTHSFWFNAVEAEVYSMSMFFTAMVFYLALVWLDNADNPRGNRVLLFLFYLIGLSLGVHLLNVLALISVAFLIVYKRVEKLTFGNFLLTGIAGGAVILAVYPGVVQGLPNLVKHFSIWSVLILLILIFWLSVVFIRKDKPMLAMASLSTFLVIIGYSTFLLIKIRSGLNPFLDENDPETWSKLLSYLNREQYGSESLFLTMFDRKAPFWTYQIKKMYLRYFGWQFINFREFLALPFILGMIGTAHHFVKDKRRWWVVFVLFIMTGLAVVLYLNQDDPQPRERDYAYVGSFFAFSIWIGIGVLALIELAQDKLKYISKNTSALIVAACCLLLVPVNMFAHNYHTHSRAGNYVAWDYSYNLLQSCEENAILYTNGDNDTFPLWYLQTVENVRTDVRVVNLSLLNTGWFIQQIRDKEPKVPMPAKITDEYIENYIDSREVSSLLDRRWLKSRRVRIDGPDPDSPPLVWDVPATLNFTIGPGGEQGYFLRVQDLMILNTIVANKWEKPIYFAVTVSDQNLIGLRNLQDKSKNFLRMDGLAFKLTSEPTEIIDAGRMAENLLKVYKYRNLNNPDVYYDDNIKKLLGNYRQGLLQLNYHYMAEAQRAYPIEIPKAERTMSLSERIDKFEELPPQSKAITTLDFMEEIIPEELVPVKYDVISLQIARIYSQLGYPDEAKIRLDRLLQNAQLNANTAYEYGVYYLSDAQDPEKARELFEESLRQNNGYENYQRIAFTWMQLSTDSSYSVELFNRYMEFDNSRQTRLRIARQSLSSGLDKLAYDIYEAMMRENPEDGEAVRGLLDYYQRMEDYSRGTSLAQDWLKRHPEDKSVSNKLDAMNKTADTVKK